MAELRQSFFKIIGEKRRPEKIFSGVLITNVFDVTHDVLPFVHGVIATSDPGQRQQLTKDVIALRVEKRLELLIGRILEDYADDATYQELKAFLDAQSDDVLRELLALTWIGRGDYTVDEWQNVLGDIKDVRDQHTAEYLLGTPLLADYLEEGLSQFGHTCEDFGGKG